jgi:hypothetical protein
MRYFLILLAAAASAALADAPSAGAQRARPATPPTLYSFADLHRLTMAGSLPAPSAGAGQSFPSLPVRLAAAQPQLSLEPAFSIRPAAPSPWLLALSGIALAGWVAHRRLRHAL